MKAFKIACIASLFSLTLVGTANACYVADPTGTPLKYRAAPYGKVLGTFRNGTYLSISGWQTDRNGKAWVQAYHPYTDKYYGWVYYKYLAC